jgi:CRISPR-associated protein Cas2
MPVNGLRIMWLFVLFDLPTLTKKQRKAYQVFHTQLEKFGYSMLQYSAYYRYSGSRESLKVHEEKIIRNLPPEGRVSIFHLTDRQFGEIRHFYCAEEAAKPSTPQQLELF